MTITADALVVGDDALLPVEGGQRPPVRMVVQKVTEGQMPDRGASVCVSGYDPEDPEHPPSPIWVGRPTTKVQVIPRLKGAWDRLTKSPGGLTPVATPPAAAAGAPTKAFVALGCFVLAVVLTAVAAFGRGRGWW